MSTHATAARQIPISVPMIRLGPGQVLNLSEIRVSRYEAIVVSYLSITVSALTGVLSGQIDTSAKAATIRVRNLKTGTIVSTVSSDPGEVSQLSSAGISIPVEGVYAVEAVSNLIGAVVVFSGAATVLVTRV